MRRGGETLNIERSADPRVELTDPDPDPDTSRSGAIVSAEGPTSVAEAQEVAIQADARAATARARAVLLRREAEASDQPNEAESPPARSVGLRRPWLRRPGRKAVATAAAVVLICAALGASGYVVWYHRTAAQERQRTAEFAAAARQGAITLMSIDANKAREDVQRIIDDTTGSFKAGIMITAEDVVKSVEQSKVSTKAAVEAVAVESMTDDSAVVLVTTRTEATNPDANPDSDKPQPRSWRLVMTLQRDGGQPKISKVEALP